MLEISDKDAIFEFNDDVMAEDNHNKNIFWKKLKKK